MYVQYDCGPTTPQEGEAGLVHHPEYLRQGNVFVQDIQKKGEDMVKLYFFLVFSLLQLKLAPSGTDTSVSSGKRTLEERKSVRSGSYPLVTKET